MDRRQGTETAEDGARAIDAEQAPRWLARAAEEAGAFLVHVSTDYVFDGTSKRGEAWLESDPVAPLGAYGRTKFEGELLIQAAAGPNHAIVRTAWLLEPGGSNFVDTMRRLGAERDELQTGVCAPTRSLPAFTGHLAEALLTIAERRAPGIPAVRQPAAPARRARPRLGDVRGDRHAGARHARHDRGVPPPRRPPRVVGPRLRAPRRHPTCRGLARGIARTLTAAATEVPA